MRTNLDTALPADLNRTPGVLLEALGGSRFKLMEFPTLLKFGKQAFNLSQWCDNQEELDAFIAGHPHTHIARHINRVRRDFDGGYASKEDITHRLEFAVDVDAGQPSGTCSTDEEKATAYSLAKDLADDFVVRLGLPYPRMVDTGNGYRLELDCEIEASPETDAVFQALTIALAKNYTRDKAHADKCVHDRARIMRLVGTINCKGESTPERPHRPCKVISDASPVVTLEQLEGAIEALGAHIPGKCDPMVVAKSVQDYLKEQGVSVPINESADKIVLPIGKKCAFKNHDPETDGNPAVLINSAGKIGFKCHHESCDGKGWGAYQKTLPETYEDFLAEPQIIDGEERLLGDPMVTAHSYLRAHRMIHLWGDFYECIDAQWEMVTKDDILIDMTCEFQAVIDKDRRRRKRLGGKKKEHVTCNTHAANARTSLATLCKRRVPKAAQVYVDSYDWDASHVRRFANGDLNTQWLIEGRGDCFRPHASELFTIHKTDFDYEPTATIGPHFKAFLGSLEFTDHELRHLQQCFGHFCFATKSLQKIEALIGPRRAGKGTLMDLAIEIIGGDAAVCSTRMDKLVTEFGLQSAIGCRAMIIDEVDTHSPTKFAGMVQQLKRMSGGGPIPVNVKNRKAEQHRFTMPIAIITNDRVALSDPSNAINARIVPVQFRNDFSGIEDEHLFDNCRSEISGICNWALEGLKALCENDWKFDPPASAIEMARDLEAASSPMRGFINECFEFDPKSCVTIETVEGLYRDYEEESTTSKAAIARQIHECDHRLSNGKLSRPDAKAVDGHKLVRSRYDGKVQRPKVLKGLRPKDTYLSTSA